MAESARGKEKDEVGSSPLHHACREGNLQDVLDLLGQCDVEQVNARKGEDGPSPLDIASRHGHVDIMKALLKSQAKVDLFNSNGPTTLKAAIAGKHCAAIGVLVDAGGDIHERTLPKYYQAIHSACEIGSVEVLETLLKYGADLESIAPGGMSSRPINLAARNGNNDVVVALLAAGTPVDYNPDKCCEFTPLQDAAHWGHPTVAKTLLEHGADVNYGSVGGWTALHNAAARNHADVVDILMQAGADPNPYAGEDVETPLHRAVAGLAHESAIALLKHGADVNATNDFEETPLHVAARENAGKKGSYDMLEILLRFGADERAVGLQDCTALSIAEGTIEECCLFEDNPSIRETEDYLTLLRDSPADRRWRRRGLVILGRAFPWKLRMDNNGEGVEDPADGVDTACLPALRQAGAGTAGNTAVGGRDGDVGDDKSADAAVVGAGAAAMWQFQESWSELEALVRSVMAMREDYRQKVVVLLWGTLNTCCAFIGRMSLGESSREEDLKDASGGSGTTSLPASPTGNTAVGGQDGDERDKETVSAVDDFSGVMSSLLMMNEDDVFRKIVMFL